MVPTAISSYRLPCPFGCRSRVVRRGRYFRKDGSSHQRFLCQECGRSFCADVEKECYREKRRDLRRPLFLLFSSGASQRRLARLLGASRTTIVRKFLSLGRHCQDLLISDQAPLPLVREMQFDDLESFEHTQCKPLSITLSVEGETRRILGFRVSSMPAKGRLAEMARKKYGPRADERSLARDELFTEIKPLLHPDCLIQADMNPHYGPDVKKHFPHHRFEVFKGRKPASIGQGELKKGAHDPLYSLNHTCAMLRANINRLFRRTWNTTKLKERLSAHIAIYAIFHNRYLIHHPAR